MAFPKWVYHKEKEPLIVHSEEQLGKLGKGWEESPAAFEVEEEAPAKKAKKKKVLE